MSGYEVGRQSCAAFRARDELIDRGVRGNVHTCYGPYDGSPQGTCTGTVSFCDACLSDHHSGGWETCPDAAPAPAGGEGMIDSQAALAADILADHGIALDDLIDEAVAEREARLREALRDLIALVERTWVVPTPDCPHGDPECGTCENQESYRHEPAYEVAVALDQPGGEG